MFKIKNKFLVLELDRIGIDSKYKEYLGYSLLLEILDLLITNKFIFDSFYKGVYPIIAKRHKKKDCTIERNIRNLINHLWKDEDGVIHNMFELKPSCCKFIYAVKNLVIKDIV